MSADLMRAMIDAALPSGSIWRPAPDGDLDKLLDGTAENLETVRLFLAGIKDVRNPALTDYLDDLEREFGVLTNLSLTEAQRREQLHPLVYGRGGGGTIDDMQTALDNAGFNVTVYANDPAVDPSPFLNDNFQMVAGGGNAFAGNAGAFAARIGGELLVNGDIFKMSRIFTSVAGTLYAGAGHGAGEYVDLLRSKVEYPVPADPADWPLVFFVGGAATFDSVFSHDEGRDLFVGAATGVRPQSCAVSSDGRWMFTCNAPISDPKLISTWKLIIPFNTSTAARVAFDLDISAQVSFARGLDISNDGLHLFVAEPTFRTVHSWTMTIPFDTKTAIYDVGKSKDVSSDILILAGIDINPDGTRFFIADTGSGRLSSWTMAIPFDPSTAIYDGLAATKSTAAQDAPIDIVVSDDGMRTYMMGANTNTVYIYDLVTPGNLSTGIHNPALDVPMGAQDSDARGLSVSPDESMMFILGSEFDSIYSFSSGLKLTAIAQAIVPAAQEQAFKRIILSKKPAHSWAALIVDFT